MKISNGLWRALPLAGLAMPAAAFAQTLPDYGQYQSLDGNYRVGVRVVSGFLANGIAEHAFQQTDIEDIDQYLDPSEIAAYLGNTAQAIQAANLGAISEVYDLRGATVLAGYVANGTTLSVRFLDRSGNTLVVDGSQCSFNYNGTSRQQSFNAFDADTDGDTANGRLLARCLGKASAAASPIDPLVGNPFSLQGTMTRDALDLSAGDSAIEGEAQGANSAGDPWQIGGIFSGGSAGRFDFQRVDARVSKGWRLFSGNRARLKLDLPFNYTRISGVDAYSGQIGLGLEMPVVARTWSLEPRVAYGISYAPRAGSAGHIVQGTIASRLVLNGVGRGYFVIGNMAGYSTTLNTPGDVNLNPDVKNWLFRNGIAYALPMKLRVGGRLTSMRASYTFTNYSGAQLYNNNFHEFTLSFGLRGREEGAKQFRDVVRLNLNSIQAKGFSTYTAGIGFLF